MRDLYTLQVLVDMVSDGDFNTRISSDARLVTVEEMLYAAEQLESGVSA